ncbi:uncharacterized protein LOC129767036 [Toxorhynchites rutilus septentrionalis]|uniref:uncharacterized protein LOC129767036 n=1 Tax=Toxorhynchites rutilus septentrionalis TaxID=329112 RepID=UPI00247A5C9E|nr:uncharacterized protein LOC129767036 [Toxorhynchites rutilus septentrionalis]
MVDSFYEDVLMENYSEESTSFDNKKNKTLRKFIEQYELSPELWNQTNGKYKNKTARNLALDRLIPFLERINPTNNTREHVNKRINSLRTNYRKELKKNCASKRSGKSADEIYTPSSWTFFALSFLERFEKPVEQKETEEVIEQELEQQQDSHGEHVRQTSVNNLSSTYSILPPPLPQTYQTRKMKSQGPISKQNMLLQKACSLLEASSNPEIPTIERAWGEKLLTLDSRQRAIAEKGINDILFEASMGSLHRDSIQINSRHSSTPNHNTESEGITGIDDHNYTKFKK